MTYDPMYFDPTTAAFVIDNQSPLSIREGPIYGAGTISVSLDIGNNTDNALRTQTKIGSIVLKPIAKTPRKTNTSISFGKLTKVVSLSSADSAQENVLSNAIPAYISIGGVKGKPNQR